MYQPFTHITHGIDDLWKVTCSKYLSNKRQLSGKQTPLSHNHQRNLSNRGNTLPVNIHIPCLEYPKETIFITNNEILTTYHQKVGEKKKRKKKQEHGVEITNLGEEACGRHWHLRTNQGSIQMGVKDRRRRRRRGGGRRHRREGEAEGRKDGLVRIFENEQIYISYAIR